MFKLISAILIITCSISTFGKTNIFYQDDDYIYRSIPDSIDVSDTELMTKLINAATEEVLDQTQAIVNAVGNEKYASTLEEIQAQIAGYLNIQENIDALNLQIETFKNSKVSKGWETKDMLPKALTVFFGLSGSASAGFSFSGSLSLGINILFDKVDRIAKRDLVKFMNNDQNYTADKISKIFDAVDDSKFISETKLLLNTLKGGKESVIRSEAGDLLKVTSYYAIDSAPVIVAAPAVGAGVGGGTAIRFGIAASWWRGNKIFEPEDLYGLGLAYSQDVSFAGAGYNFKLGAVNSDSADGWIDYIYSSFSFAFGPQTEFSPLKGNILFMKQPMWLLEKLGLGDKAEQLIDTRLDESFGKKWEEVTGLPPKRRRN